MAHTLRAAPKRGIAMEIVKDQLQLQHAQEQFKMSFLSLPYELVHTTIGYQGGNYEAAIIWVPSLGIWGFFGLPPNEKSPGERFWNPFGLGMPPSEVSIVCEVNPPRRGVNARTGGVFLRDNGGAIVVAHRGRFTVTGGMKTQYFLERFKGQQIGPPSGQKKPLLVRVAQLQTASFGQEIAQFIKEVHRIKELKRQENARRKQGIIRAAYR